VLRHEVTDEPVCTLADDDYLEKFRNTMIGWPACNALRIWWVDQLRPVSRSHSAIR